MTWLVALALPWAAGAACPCGQNPTTACNSLPAPAECTHCGTADCRCRQMCACATPRQEPAPLTAPGVAAPAIDLQMAAIVCLPVAAPLTARAAAAAERTLFSSALARCISLSRLTV